MSQEIERRFLLDQTKAPELAKGPYLRSRIQQFFLSSDPERIVRVRLITDATPGWLLDAMTLEADPAHACITIKGAKQEGAGIEVETGISAAEAEALRPLAVGQTIDKIRYRVGIENNLVAEIDVFASPADLVIVEVEFKSNDSARCFQPPAWFGREITQDPSYSNQAIALGVPRG